MFAARSARRIVPRRRVERERARQEVHAEVEAAACDEQVLDLRVGLRAAEHGVEVGKHELWHEKAECARKLACDHLGDERPPALTCSAELQDIEAVVIGFHERGQRAALAEGRDIPRRIDSPKLHVEKTIGAISGP